MKRKNTYPYRPKNILSIVIPKAFLARRPGKYFVLIFKRSIFLSRNIYSGSMGYLVKTLKLSL